MTAIFTFSIFLASCLIQLIAHDTSTGIYDEGIILSGAIAISEGKTPYKDFWTLYGPAQFYLISWVFNLFSENSLSARCIGIFFKSWITVAVFLVSRKILSEKIAISLSAGSLFFLIAQRNDLFPIFPALALGLTTIYLFNESMLRKDTRFAVLAGICFGLLALFRHDMGFYSAAAVLLASAFHLSGHAKLDSKLLVKTNVAGAIGVFATLPIWALLINQVPTRELVDQLLIAPATIYPQQRALPFPTFFNGASTRDFLVYLPFATTAIWLLTSARGLFRQAAKPIPTEPPTESQWLLTALALISIFFSLKGIVRVSILHMTPAIIASTITSAYLIKHPPLTRMQKKISNLILIFFTLLFITASLKGLSKFTKCVADLTNATDSIIYKLCTSPQLERIRCTNMDPDYIDAAKYVIATSKPGEHIFVGADRHDKLFITPVALYFATDRPSATKWMELHPGVATNLSVQQAIVRELESRVVRILILDGNFKANREPNASSVSSQVYLLDRYIQNHYELTRTFGEVRIMQRKN